MRQLIILLIALATPFLLFLARIAPHLHKSVMDQPRGRRWPVVKAILRAFVPSGRTRRLPQSPDEAAFRMPDDARRTVPYEQWHQVSDLVANARQVSSLQSRTSGVSLDIDGSVVVIRYRDETTSDIAVVAPDGSFRAITGPEGVVAARWPMPSIDRGTVAWWQIAIDGKSAHLWVAEPSLTPRMLHTESLPKGQPLPLAPDGWVLVAGDKVAWTMLTGSEGTIGVTSLDGTTHRVGRTRFPTLHRDTAAEREGRRVAAVSVMEGDAVDFGQVGELSLDGPIPVLRLLRSGTYPGASVCDGSVVGFWLSQRVLQLPGGLWVHMPQGSSAIDFTSDGEWCAGNLFRAPQSRDRERYVGELFHLPTGVRQRLCEQALGPPQLRAGRILWSWAAETGRDFAGASSWVGDLRAPSLSHGAGPAPVG
ncbi:hypothetical protein LGT39_10295 [Demequina sp. TTPB684]|uniref:hypothetical protein n=1 Tax=unclassified Demequina TaxID=2620311 RepID=UPI001CF2E007|nr:MULTISPECIES: hypothetical protein [unclassified Demequina]MCB2413231.1 hypothetical protein [Demequina sp. TTPB684]UPU88194.1 hypothetical protein LGT36_013255 [Demequina sp. TMPB413]